MTTEEFLETLEAVRKQGSGFVARCPAHEDRTASLSIREGEDGKTVVHCHAGCTYKSIIAALGLDLKDLSGRDTVTGEPEAVYTYEDEDGNTLYEVCRFPGKKFRQRQPNGDWNVRNVRRVPYRLPEVIAAAKVGGTVYFVEGEKDVEALRSRGKVATCNMGGALKWEPEFADFFRGVYAIIVTDKDEPGRKHADMVRDSLAGKARAITVVQARKGKDAADHLAAGFKPEEFVPVRDRRHSGITTSGEMADKTILIPTKKKENTTVLTNPWGIEEPQFAKGRIYVASGWTGDGKSVICCQVFRHMAEAGIRTCYLTNEMTEEDLRNRLLCHKGFKLKELEQPWLMAPAERERLLLEAEAFRSWNADIIFDTQANHEKVADYLDDGAYDFLIFDHLHRIESSASGEEAAIAREIRGFTNLALNYEIPVLIAAQLRRPPPGTANPRPSIHDFKGSSAIEQEAAMALSIWRTRDSSGKIEGSSAELGVLKNRHGRSGYSTLLSFHGEEFRFTKGEDKNDASASIWG